jgi:hypothetical protein
MTKWFKVDLGIHTEVVLIIWYVGYSLTLYNSST